METMWLCVSAGSGPEECAHAAALTVRVLLREIENCPEAGVKAGVIEEEPSAVKGNIRSALIVLEGKGAEKIAAS